MNVKTIHLQLDRIIEASDNIMAFVEGYDVGKFLNDIKTQQAVSLSFIIIGEAVAKIIDDFPDTISSNPEIEWYKIKGLRNIIAHSYHQINTIDLWNTIIKDVPKLNVQIKILLKSLE